MKSWKGPVKVVAHRGRSVFVMANGNLRKVADCRVQPYDNEGYEEETKLKSNDVGENDEKEKGDDSSNEEEEDSEVKIEKRRTRLDSLRMKDDKKKDCVRTYWMSVGQNECFNDEVVVMTVEIPRKEHGKIEAIEAKNKEVDNLTRYGTFEEVPDEGKEKITSRWVVTKKLKQDGQKEDVKARLVARGFQETVDPQSDSPTALRESNKLFYAIAANENFNLRSMDIKAAFLQSNELDREVLVEPPADIKKPGVVWRLVKPLYGLKDASRKFWLRMKEIFRLEGLKTVRGDEAFYYKHDGNVLQGMVLTHVDDFGMAGTDEFLDDLEKKIKKTLNVSKVEKDKFRFTGIDVERSAGRIKLSMEDYADSIEEIGEVRAGEKSDELTKVENKLYRKYVGKIGWL